MRYRCGPVSGTVVMTALSAMGIYGEIAVGWRKGQSIASDIFGTVVIALFVWFAAVGLNDLRGVRTEKKDDGTAVLKLPGFLPTSGRWWHTFPATEIDSVTLVNSGGRRPSYDFAVVLHDGERYTSDAVSCYSPRFGDLDETRASSYVAQIRRDLGLAPA